MPFGLVNAPATFQAMINTILRKFLDHGVVVYLDDILIDSKNEEEHVELVKRLLAQLENFNLAVSTTKSVFHVKEVEFLGYKIAVDRVGSPWAKEKYKASKFGNIQDRWKIYKSLLVLQSSIDDLSTIFQKFANQTQKHLNRIHESSTKYQSKMKYSKN